MTPTLPRVFVSHAGPDTDWAEWVAWQLRAAKYGVELDRWSWSVGDNFVLRMSAALQQSDIVVALLSSAYFESGRFIEDEWSDVIAARGKLVPLRIENVTLPPLLRSRIYADLFGRGETEARTTLMRAIEGAEPPDRSPEFPGRLSTSVPAPPSHGGPRLPGQLPDIWNVPTRSPDFSGRDELLDQLREMLRNETSVPFICLHGIGGVGKTLLAIEFAHRFAADYDLVWWVDAEEPTLVPVHLASVAGEVGSPTTGLDAETLFKALCRDLRRRERWLLIYDDAKRASDLSQWLPQGPGHILITSRDPAWQGLARPVAIGDFNRKESIAFLTSQLPHLDTLEADQLAAALGDLPLALAQAAGVVRNAGLDVPGYLQSLSQHANDILKQGTPASYAQSFAACLQVTYTRLAVSEPAALQLLQVLAYLAPSPIFMQWLSQLPSNHLPPDLAAKVKNIPAFSEVWRHLTSYGLVRVSASNVSGLVLHRLIAAVTRDYQTAGERSASRTVAEQVLIAATPKDPEDPKTWRRWEAVLPHLTFPPLVETLDETLADLICRAIEYLLAQAQPRAALQLAIEVKQARARYGSHDPYAIRSTILTQRVHYLLGQPREGRELGREVLARCRESLGPDHPHTLDAAQNLAYSLRQAGETTAARALDKDTLARRRRVLGEDHPDTLGSAHNLAVDLRWTGQYSQARALDEDTLARRRRVLGEDHPETLRSAASLGGDLRRAGEHSQARALDEDTLARRRRVLGEDHPDTLRSAHHLSVDLASIGEHAQARALDEDTLARRRRVLGEDHPDTLSSRETTALAYLSAGRLSEAVRLLEQNLRERVRILGPGHPNTVRSRDNLTRARREAGLID